MPDWTSLVRTRLVPLRLDPARELEIVEELSQHLDQRYDELRNDGRSEADARRIAADGLLDLDALARHMRPLRQANVPPPIAPGTPRRHLVGDLWQDLRYAARLLRRQPGFAAAAVLTLALGLGANTAIFALVDATLLRPLPFPAPGDLVMLREHTDASPPGPVSPVNLRDWRDRNQTLSGVAGFVPNVGGMVMTGADGTAETVPRQWVTAGFFDVLGVRPTAGRFFTTTDDVQRSRVVVLSHSFWRQRYGADPRVVGREVRLDGNPYTIVGVAPDEVHQLGRTSLWGLIPIEAAPPRARGVYMFYAVGRVKPGIATAAAEADLARVAGLLATEFPATNQGRGVTLDPLNEAVIGADLRQTSILFLGVVAFVLLICCANVANLLLARATARTRELALRSAIGADRIRIVRQLTTESLLLSIVGGLLGLGVGAAILEIAPLVIPEGLLPPALALAVDLRVAGVCLAAVLVVGLLFGLAPAWFATGVTSSQGLAGGGRTMTARGGRLRNTLVAAEVATAVLLLVGAGLLLRTLLAVEGVDRGYRADRVLTMFVDPLGSRYRGEGALVRFYDAVAQEVEALPGVRRAAFASTLPMGPSSEGASFFAVEGNPPPPESQRPTADFQIVSPAYFDAVELPIVAGRSFTDRDAPTTVQVCIVNEAFVRTHLSGQSPIGRRIATRPTSDDGAPAVVREIVGVARQVKGRPDETEDLLQIYVPLAQAPTDDIFLLVRSASGPADALAPSVRAAIGRIDREQLVSVRDVQTLEDVAWTVTARHRFRAVLVTAFAALALVLAMVGLFGILAFAVQQRVREFAVRRALGASAADVIRPVVASALKVTGAGALAGLVLAGLLGRLVATMLFGVAPLDPATFVLVAGLLLVTAVAAVAAPARRALRVDPATALRGD